MADVDTDPVTLPGDLTPRELDVLVLVGYAMSNAQIARKLCIEESTVKTHVQNLLTNLDVRTRVQAALIASRDGLADEPGPCAPPRDEKTEGLHG